MLFHDLRHISRTARSAPGFLVLAVLTLGIGIGGTTAMYSFVSSVLLAPLPYDDPETLVVVTRNNREQGFEGLMVPARDVASFREQAESFSHVSGYTTRRVTLTGSETPENVRGARILPGFLSLLGIAPSMVAGLMIRSFVRLVSLPQELLRRSSLLRALASGEQLAMLLYELTLNQRTSTVRVFGAKDYSLGSRRSNASSTWVSVFRFDL